MKNFLLWAVAFCIFLMLCSVLNIWRLLILFLLFWAFIVVVKKVTA